MEKMNSTSSPRVFVKPSIELLSVQTSSIMTASDGKLNIKSQEGGVSDGGAAKIAMLTRLSF